MSEVGVLNEIGDMGLGFDPLNDKDQKAYNESVNKENQDKNTDKNDK